MDMALLDMQGMDSGRSCDEGAKGGGSGLSVAICDSAASVNLCL